MTPELDALAERIEEIEKQIAHVAGLVVSHFAADRAIIGRHFVVTDDDGMRRAELCMSAMAEGGKTQPVLAIFGEDGRIRASFGMSPGGPTLQLHDGNGNVRLKLQADASRAGEPLLVMSDAGEQPSIVIRTGNTDTSVYLRDPKNPGGNTSVQIAVSSDEVSILSVKGGRVLWASAEE